MTQMLQLALALKTLVWSPPLLALLMGAGAVLTVRLGFIQFRYLVQGLKESVKEGQGKGDISHFQALMTSLAGAIGTGNIVGIATAVSIGGFGALFWMWVSALLGMATKYGEAVLALRYRTLDARGEIAGGPMYFLQRGLGWKSAATFFAFFALFGVMGTGNLVQVNSIADVVWTELRVPNWITGVIASCITAAVILGGVKSIGKVAALLVPGMALVYVSLGLWIIGQNIDLLPEAFFRIFREAFTGRAALGGGMLLALQMGVSRGVFSNEAGLGISSIAAAAAQTDVPARQAIVAMSGAFLSTLVVCSITGLVLAVTGVMETGDLQGARLALLAFEKSIPFGAKLASMGLILFAYSTIIGWAYYGEKCAEYLLGEASIFGYRIVFCLLMVPGAIMDLDVVWAIADSFNGLMAIPSLIGVLALLPVIIEESKQLKKLN